MTTAAPTKSQPHIADEKPLAEYRSIAPLAVIAVGLGIASALILTSPLLAPVPVAGIVVAIAALRSIRASAEQLAGRPAAIVGLCLSVFFLGLGLTRHVARQGVLEQKAIQMADVFIRLLQEGKTREAHQFRLAPSVRITAPEAIAEHYEKNAEAASELQSFIGSTGVRNLISRGRDGDVRFDSVSSATRDGKNDMLVLKYSYVPSAERPSDRQTLWVHINRKYDESTKRHEWEVGGISDRPPIGSSE